MRYVYVRPPSVIYPAAGRVGHDPAAGQSQRQREERPCSPCRGASSHCSRSPEAPGPACVRRRRRDNPRSSTTRGIRRRSAMEVGALVRRAGGHAGSVDPLLPEPRTLLVLEREDRCGADARDRRRRHHHRRRLLVGAEIAGGRSPRARRARPPSSVGLDVAIHLEPVSRPQSGARRRTSSDSRTPGSPTSTCDADRAPAAGGRKPFPRSRGAHVRPHDLRGRAKASGFDGLYTYDVVTWTGSMFAASAHRLISPASCVRRRSGRATTPAWRRATGS